MLQSATKFYGSTFGVIVILTYLTQNFTAKNFKNIRCQRYPDNHQLHWIPLKHNTYKAALTHHQSSCRDFRHQDMWSTDVRSTAVRCAHVFQQLAEYFWTEFRLQVLTAAQQYYRVNRKTKPFIKVCMWRHRKALHMSKCESFICSKISILHTGSQFIYSNLVTLLTEYNNSLVLIIINLHNKLYLYLLVALFPQFLAYVHPFNSIEVAILRSTLGNEVLWNRKSYNSTIHIIYPSLHFILLAPPLQ